MCCSLMHFARHVQSVRFITKAFLLQEFIIYFILFMYLYMYLFNQRRLINKYDILPAYFSEKTHSVFLLLLP